jgi:YHS domain-containing protein
MEVNEATAAGTSVYRGMTYFFCSPGCKQAFDKEPEKYVSSESGHAGPQSHSSHHH